MLYGRHCFDVALVVLLSTSNPAVGFILARAGLKVPLRPVLVSKSGRLEDDCTAPRVPLVRKV